MVKHSARLLAHSSAIHDVLARVPATQIREALESLTPVSRLADGSAVAEAVTEQWIARLSEKYFETDPEWQHSAVLTLDDDGRPLAVKSLLRIAAGEILPPANNAEDVSGRARALYCLARRKHRDVPAILADAAAKLTGNQDRLVLQVARAFYEGPSELGLEHLRIKYSVIAESAWTLLADAPSFNPSLEFLVAATSDSNVQSAAAAVLARRGVRVLTARESSCVAHGRFYEAHRRERRARTVST